MNADTTGDRRSTIGWLALTLVAISALGMIVLIVGDIAGIEGAQEGEEGWWGFTVAWIAFSLGGIAALLTGAVAFFLGRRSGDDRTQTAGLVALGYFVLAVVVLLIAA